MNSNAFTYTGTKIRKWVGKINQLPIKNLKDDNNEWINERTIWKIDWDIKEQRGWDWRYSRAC
jgi:hypothetical protein